LKPIVLALDFVARYWWQLTLANLLAITVLSLLPLAQLPDAPGTDKLHHLVAYGLLAFPVCLAKQRRALFLLLVFVAWGGGIELLQPYVNRYAEWLDFAANSIGVVLGAALGFISQRWRRRA